MKMIEAINAIKCNKPTSGYTILCEALDMAVDALEKQMPKQVRTREPSSVKAFDGENKILTYRCYPCPTCGKWIIDNENHKYCQWCGQALDWSAHPTEKGGASDA